MPEIRGRTWCRASIGVGILALVALAGQASSATPAANTAAARHAPGTRSASTQADSGVSELPPNDSALLAGATGLSTSVWSGKSKVAIDLSNIYGVLYLEPTYRTAPYIAPNGQNLGELVPVPAGFRPAHPKAGCRYLAADEAADVYSMSTPSGAPFDPNHPTPEIAIGKFAPTNVSMLAFGSIPVTATLNASEPLKRVPAHGDTPEHYTGQMLVDLYNTFQSQDINNNLGCDPTWEAEMPQLWTHATGPVDINVSNVRVDGQPVDVGSDCHTATPTQLNLWGDPNYIPVAGGFLYQQEDRVNYVDSSHKYLLHPGSTNLTIPPFAGCRGKNGEDLSRLITAMVSGDDNTAAVQQGFFVFDPAKGKIDPVTGNNEGFNPQWPLSCSASSGLCPTPPGYVVPPIPGASNPPKKLP